MSWVEEDEFSNRKRNTKMLAFDEIKRDRWGRKILHPAAIEQNRLQRLARDQELETPTTAEGVLQVLDDLASNLEDNEADDLVTLIEQRLEGSDPAAQDRG